LVGRYFCDHPQLPIGFGVVNEETFRPDRTVYVGPTAAFLRRSNIRNFTLQVILEDTFGSTGTKRWIQELACMMPFATRLEMAYSGEFPHWWCDFRLVVVTEQALNRDSRVKLGEPVDRFGHRRIDLDWRLTDLEFRTMRLAGLRLAETFADADLGRIRLDDWILRDDVTLPPLREVSLFGAHHMCTTRMSDRPETGVVDENGTVFGLANLHIVGSSVFATPGCANPTLTIVQMALRQADLLAAQSKI
jgi:hypothetical protein